MSDDLKKNNSANGKFFGGIFVGLVIAAVLVSCVGIYLYASTSGHFIAQELERQRESFSSSMDALVAEQSVVFEKLAANAQNSIDAEFDRRFAGIVALELERIADVQIQADQDRSKQTTLLATQFFKQYEQDLGTGTIDQETVKKREFELREILQDPEDSTREELNSAVNTAIWYHNLSSLVSEQFNGDINEQISMVEELQESMPLNLSPDIQGQLTKMAQNLQRERARRLFVELKQIQTNQRLDDFLLGIGDGDIPVDMQAEFQVAIQPVRQRILTQELNLKVEDFVQQLEFIETVTDIRVRRALVQQVDAQCRLLAAQTAQIEQSSVDLKSARDSLLEFWNQVQDVAWETSRAPYLKYQAWAADELEEVRSNDKKKIIGDYKNKKWDDPKGLARKFIGGRLVKVFGLIDVSQLDPALAQQYHNLYLRDLQEVDEEERFEIARKIAVHPKKKVAE
jgi:hypothetical protein